ncbi:hypothetical protein [Psychrobacillus sp. FJAT-21963]|uniref:hypothetical protein n=1 Tax=Psychrobacillus sp. FJAT-21963 TaxID=1712028 RepID=UPI0012E27517|nr:hypothetical protein [Psychrobacillus sp. FJAT-21963]
MEKKYTVLIEYSKGYAREFKTNKKPKRVNPGVLKVDNYYLNMINVERYLVNGFVVLE